MDVKSMLPGVEGFAAIGALPPMLEELKAVQLPPTFAESAARLTAALGHLMPKELVAIVSEFSLPEEMEDCEAVDRSGYGTRLTMMARAGIATVQLRLAVFVEGGCGFKRNSFTAFLCYRIAARSGSREAREYLPFWRPCATLNQLSAHWFTVAHCNGAPNGARAIAEFGLSRIENSTSVCAAFSRSAALKGLVPAFSDLALSYSMGDGIAKSQSAAWECYRICNAMGTVDLDPVIAHDQATCLYNGDGCAIDRVAALTLMRRAAMQGLPEALLFLASLLSKKKSGLTDSKSDESLGSDLIWRTYGRLKGAAALQGNTNACYELGMQLLKKNNPMCMAGLRDMTCAPDLGRACAAAAALVTINPITGDIGAAGDDQKRVIHLDADVPGAVPICIQDMALYERLHELPDKPDVSDFHWDVAILRLDYADLLNQLDPDQQRECLHWLNQAAEHGHSVADFTLWLIREFSGIVVKST